MESAETNIKHRSCFDLHAASDDVDPLGEVAEQLVKNGIKAIWNFAHVDLNVPKGIQVENVHLSDSLMKLSYNLGRYENERDAGK